MCIFQSGSDIPPLVRLSLRTLQYLVVPLLSLSILCIGALHLGELCTTYSRKLINDSVGEVIRC